MLCINPGLGKSLWFRQWKHHCARQEAACPHFSASCFHLIKASLHFENGKCPVTVQWKSLLSEGGYKWPVWVAQVKSMALLKVRDRVCTKLKVETQLNELGCTISS